VTDIIKIDKENIPSNFFDIELEIYTHGTHLKNDFVENKTFRQKIDILNNIEKGVGYWMINPEGDSERDKALAEEYVNKEFPPDIKPYPKMREWDILEVVKNMLRNGFVDGRRSMRLNKE
jgi:hypothetical protein